MRAASPRARERETQGLERRHSHNADYDARFSVFAKSSQASASVMAITKCRIWVPPVNRFTAAARVLSQCGRTGATDSPRRFDGEDHEQEQ